MAIECPLKKKYRIAHRSGFVSKTSNGGSGSKKLLRPDKSAIPRPKHAKYVRHFSGSWWGGRPKRQHA